jgi:hypothetical protein
MLSQNFIPTRTPPATELVAGTHELVAELQERLRAGESFDNPKLTEIADRSFGGTRAQGRYTSRDAYDALEIAVNKYLDSQARELTQMDVTDALASVLRPLTKRLARQCDLHGVRASSLVAVSDLHTVRGRTGPRRVAVQSNS